MTKEKLLERKKLLTDAMRSLKNRAAQLISQRDAINEEIKVLVRRVNANDTAIQECDYWLNEREPGEKVEEIKKIQPIKQTIIDTTKKKRK